MKLGANSASALVGGLAIGLAILAVGGCRSGSGTDESAGLETTAPGSARSEGVGSDVSVPESSARVVASLPESSVVVIDPDVASRSERVEELAESVGATLEGDTARIVVEESVLFEFGSADLLDSASDVLDDIAELLTELAAERIDVVGHTDAVGSDQYNLDLSDRRARAVEEALIERGVDDDVIEATGRGEADPIAPNENPDGTDNPEGRARNRRVEVTATGLDD